MGPNGIREWVKLSDQELVGSAHIATAENFQEKVYSSFYVKISSTLQEKETGKIEVKSEQFGIHLSYGDREISKRARETKTTFDKIIKNDIDMEISKFREDEINKLL